MFRAFAPSWLWLAITRDNVLSVGPNPRYEDSVFTLNQ